MREKVLFPSKDVRHENQMDISQQEADRDVLGKLFAFVTIHSKEHEVLRKLNPTLGGYVNKVLSLWMLKRPDEMASFFCEQKARVLSVTRHLYLGSCMSDLLVRICSIKGVSKQLLSEYEELRSDIVQELVNHLDLRDEQIYIDYQPQQKEDIKLSDQHIYNSSLLIDDLAHSDQIF